MRALVGIGLVLAGLALAGPVRADDDDEDDEFDTLWFGARLGLWYRPEIDMKVQVNGRLLGGGLGTLFGTSLDIQRDLGVEQTVQSEYMFQNGVFEGEVFFDSRWISLSVWAVAPFRYEGNTVLQRSITFAGVTFTASQPVTSRFEQFFAGTDLKINLLNNSIVAISPLVGVRALAVDWEIRAGPPLNVVADTSDVDSPLAFGEFELIPYPVVGAQVKVGIRRWFEVDAQLAGMYISYDDVAGGSIQGDLGATVWPIPWIGLRLGGRYVLFDFKSRDQNRNDAFDFDLEYLGANISLIVRI